MDRMNPAKDLIYLAATKAFDQFNQVGRGVPGGCPCRSQLQLQQSSRHGRGARPEVADDACCGC
jgi:hypothetical protein